MLFLVIIPQQNGIAKEAGMDIYAKAKYNK